MGFLEKLLGRADAEEDDLANLDGAAKEMIQGVVELSRSTVKEIMVPRPDVISVSLDTPAETLVERVAASGHSRLPVYHQNMDNIVGVVYAKDMLRDQVSGGEAAAEEPVLERIMRRPYFVPETKKVDELLREFQLRHVHIAVIVDEYGGTSGIVCLEDVIEEIVGDIQDEFDNEAEEILKIGEGIYLCDARVRLDELNEHSELELPAADFETLGGFVFDLFGKIPVKYEKESYGPADFVIQQMEGNRITSVKIVVRRGAPAGADATAGEDSSR
jgi:CBS domain containing-hemolysin-like protein